ncbi:MAG: hypothetical protein IKN00_04050 [Bacteroidales bacterium]|nr:hypothetical protein [Bacteroidales bacterium]
MREKILAIDPGNTESAYVMMEPGYEFVPAMFGKFSNGVALDMVKDLARIWGGGMTVVIEMVASYGMAVGKEVFDTCVWIGRFTQAAKDAGCRVEYVYRMEEKMALCHNSKARDSNIRQALIDRFARFDKKNGKGTKAHPDIFYGYSKDIWAACAVGVTWLDKQGGKNP